MRLRRSSQFVSRLEEDIKFLTQHDNTY